MSITMTSRSGPDGKLRLEVPVSQPGVEYQVVISVQAKGSGIKLPPDYFDLIGSITDETFDRPPQGEQSPSVVME